MTRKAKGKDRDDLSLPTEVILSALPLPVLVLRYPDAIVYANAAAEAFLGASCAMLARYKVTELFSEDSPLLDLIGHVIARRLTVSEYGIELGGPRLKSRLVDLQAAPAGDAPNHVVVIIQERMIAEMVSQQESRRNALRTVTGMAAVLAHEIKNPLSGIRGAAQLLEGSANGTDRELATLIRDETDRITTLVDRMEIFQQSGPVERQPVNIHEVLKRVRQVASTGFASSIRFNERFDPSLPPVYGDRDQLIQVFLNLVKNAAEATGGTGKITLTTAYRSGMGVMVPGGRAQTVLPLEVSVEDNGPGIPNEQLPYLFEPFMTTKGAGDGLGLAIVSKIVADHSGTVECDSAAGRTVFRIRLPIDRSAEYQTTSASGA